MKRKKLQGLIFDLDGTLVDSRLDFGLIRREMGVPTGHPIIEYMEAVSDEAAKSKMLAILHEHELAGASRATLIPGVWDFLKRIDEQGLKKAILTRNFADPTSVAMTRLGLGGFSSVMTRENARPKPDPEGLLKICAEWAVSVDEVLFIGDYKFDLMAGKAAGMKTILYCDESPLPDYAEMADVVVKGFGELIERWEEILNRLGFESQKSKDMD